VIAVSLAPGSSLIYGFSDFLGGLKSRSLPLLSVCSSPREARAFARIYLCERLERPQQVGAAIALGGAVAISALPA
jgi:hypothetical protein